MHPLALSVPLDDDGGHDPLVANPNHRAPTPPPGSISSQFQRGTRRRSSWSKMRVIMYNSTNERKHFAGELRPSTRARASTGTRTQTHAHAPTTRARAAHTAPSRFASLVLPIRRFHSTHPLPVSCTCLDGQPLVVRRVVALCLRASARLVQTLYVGPLVFCSPWARTHSPSYVGLQAVAGARGSVVLH
jgi:hypothetical protein